MTCQAHPLDDVDTVAELFDFACAFADRIKLCGPLIASPGMLDLIQRFETLRDTINTNELDLT